MEEVDRFPVEGATAVEQNGNLCLRIGDKPYKIKTILREPKNAEPEDQEWVILGEW